MPNNKHYWSGRETARLMENYLIASISELRRKFQKRGRIAIVRKLQRLGERFPELWDAERITYLNNEVQRTSVRRNHKKASRLHKQAHINEDSRRAAYLRFSEKQKQWTERDIIILANTYFTRNWDELTRIFAFKETPFEVKLRNLYNGDHNSWEKKRIVELEQESKEYSELTKIKLKGYYSSLAYCRKLELREDIDTLLQQGKTRRQIGKGLNISYPAVNEYVSSRNLNRWCDLIRKQKYS